MNKHGGILYEIPCIDIIANIITSVMFLKYCQEDQTVSPVNYCKSFELIVSGLTLIPF